MVNASEPSIAERQGELPTFLTAKHYKQKEPCNVISLSADADDGNFAGAELSKFCSGNCALIGPPTLLAGYDWPVTTVSRPRQ
jgi:hypothetical protein